MALFGVVFRFNDVSCVNSCNTVELLLEVEMDIL